MDALAPYLTLLRSRVSAQASYRVSFGLEVAGSVALCAAEFAEVYVIFHNIRALGGLDFDAALLLFGLSTVAFSLSALLAGTIDDLTELVRTGRLDVLLLRPLPLLAQLVTGDFTLKRCGRFGLALVILAVALARNDIHWTAAKAALVVVAPLAGAALFLALFVVAGAMQFWLIGGRELASSFTYASNYASSFSAAILPLPLRLLFTFVVPAAFAGYLPTLVLLDLPGPTGLPAWLGWCTPIVAIITWAGAMVAWRRGIARYTGAGG